MSVAYNDSRIPVRDRRTGVLGAAVGFFHLLDRSIAAATAFENLSEMSDSELARRGLERPDIAKHAFRILMDGS